MGSKPNGVEAWDHPFPPVVLDTTFAELLTQDPANDGAASVKESLCNSKPNSDPAYKAIPTNNKYLITSAQLTDSVDLAHLQLENTAYLLSFWAGDMEVNLVGSEGWSEAKGLTKDAIQKKGEASFGVLNEKQRPRVRTFANAYDIIDNYGNESKCRWGFAVDFAEQVNSWIHPEQHYKLNAKRWLAECPLLSANDQIIDCEAKCNTHHTKEGLWYYGVACEECLHAIDAEVERVQAILGEREPPFVFKLTQCLGSAGTTLVKTKEDRTKLLEFVRGNQKLCMPRLTETNAHVHPTSYVVSDFLPGSTMALNFYIKRDGTPVPLGVCHQLTTRGTGGRQQTALTWDHQDRLNAHYKDKLAEIGRVLHDEGYYGPAGADIMETEDGTQYVIDLNVRTATSLILGILRGHCEQRGFDACLVYECLLLRADRQQLYKHLKKEFEEGRIIIMGCTRLGEKNLWAYPVVLAGETQDVVRKTSDNLLKFESEDAGDAADAGGG